MDPRQLVYDVLVDSMHHGEMSTVPFRGVGDLFIFIGLLVCIGSIGVYALYRIWKEFVRGD